MVFGGNGTSKLVRRKTIKNSGDCNAQRALALSKGIKALSTNIIKNSPWGMVGGRTV